jgi:molybdate transport system permease protein
VIGFYLLILFAPQSVLGSSWIAITGHTLAFSFSGLVVGSIIYSLPFAIQPFQAALRTVPEALLDAARMDGASVFRVFRHITLPLASRGIAVGVILSFAHTIGEFGVVLMLGGSIPGRTKVAAVALYDEVQKLNYGLAHAYALVLVTVSFALLLCMSILRRTES